MWQLDSVLGVYEKTTLHYIGTIEIVLCTICFLRSVLYSACPFVYTLLRNINCVL